MTQKTKIYRCEVDVSSIGTVYVQISRVRVDWLTFSNSYFSFPGNEAKRLLKRGRAIQKMLVERKVY